MGNKHGVAFQHLFWGTHVSLERKVLSTSQGVVDCISIIIAHPLSRFHSAPYRVRSSGDYFETGRRAKTRLTRSKGDFRWEEEASSSFRYRAAGRRPSVVNRYHPCCAYFPPPYRAFSLAALTQIPDCPPSFFASCLTASRVATVESLSFKSLLPHQLYWERFPELSHLLWSVDLRNARKRKVLGGKKIRAYA